MNTYDFCLLFLSSVYIYGLVRAASVECVRERYGKFTRMDTEARRCKIHGPSVGLWCNTEPRDTTAYDISKQHRWARLWWTVRRDTTTAEDSRPNDWGARTRRRSDSGPLSSTPTEEDSRPDYWWALTHRRSDSGPLSSTIDKPYSFHNGGGVRTHTRGPRSRLQTTFATQGEMEAAAVNEICCGGYVFHMSDGSTFSRSDVELVKIKDDPSRGPSLLSASPRRAVSRKRKRAESADDVVTAFVKDVDGDEFLKFHLCPEDDSRGAESFVVSNRCDAWCRLSDAQRDALNEIQTRVDADRAEHRHFSCAIIEGPGGCGKTRLMCNMMNHRRANTIVLYVTKQNKRVQDFIHADCLSGETAGSGVGKPIDLSGRNHADIKSVLQCSGSVGTFAVTAEKLVCAISGLRPAAFGKDATASSLGVNYEIFKRPCARPERNVVLLLDEYTMLQPPLIHATAYYVMSLSLSPLLLVMAGDKLQCGPINWDDATAANVNDAQLYTNDVRRECVAKMDYEPLEVRMENVLRCRGDTALASCVKRLRRVCEDNENKSFRTSVSNMVLARFSLESGVDLFRQSQSEDGVSVIRKICPADAEALDFGGRGLRIESGKINTGNDPEEYLRGLEDEEFDERGVVFVSSPDPPSVPRYDVLPLVRHFAALYTELASISFTGDTSEERMADLIYESAKTIRHLLLVFIVLTNRSCNVLAESLLLALYTQVRERVLSAPLPESLAGNPVRDDETAWAAHLERTLRQNVRCIRIDEQEAIRRQTLFVGMVYKMTQTTRDGNYCLCNGETVVLTSIVFNDHDTLDSLEAVVLRKLDRDSNIDFTLPVGSNKNRMTVGQERLVMPFVPYTSENIYQMQGMTVPANARTFVDLVRAPCKSSYVALSRFQSSDSIQGIVISDTSGGV